MTLSQELRQAAQTSPDRDLLERAAAALEFKDTALKSCITLFENDLQGLPIIQPDLRFCRAALSTQGEKTS